MSNSLVVLYRQILQKTKFIHDAGINVLKSQIKLRLKRTMNCQDTLGFESLGLEKPAVPQNASRAKKGKSKHAKDEASLPSENQQAYGQHTASDSSSDPPSLLSYQQLPIATLAASAETLNHWPRRDRHQQVTPASPDTSKNQPVQIVSRSNPLIPFVQAGLSSNSPRPTVQKCTLYSKANPPPIETIQRGRWIGSPPANLRKALSQPSRSAHSTKTRDSKVISPAIRKSPPCTKDGQDDLIHLPAPAPTSVYLHHAHVIPHLLPSPQRLLLVLDLNGTLLYRARASQNYTPRPYLAKFLKYAFANHSLIVWSSAQPHNVRAVCARLFSRDQRKMLLGEWGRDTLGLTAAEYKARVQVYKRLDRIWSDENIQHLHPEEGNRWNQQNSVLIDDSALKASAQPSNHVEVPEFVRDGDEREGGGKDVLGQVMDYLEEARKWSDVSGFVRHRPFEIGAGWRLVAEEKSTGA